MGWRERDYAKWTDDERRKYLGTGAAGLPTDRGSMVGEGRRLFRLGVGVAIAASAAAFALGHFPRGNPIVPAFQVRIPSIGAKSSPTTASNGERDLIAKIRLPTSAQVGGFLTIRGQLGAQEAGIVSVEGAYRRPPWRLLAAVPSHASSFDARILLSQTGLLHLRITYPDSHRAVGTIRVVR